MIRRFDISISCASCIKKINKVFSQYKDIKYSINLIEKMLIVEADENKYPSNFIIDLINQSGYVGIEI